MTSKLRLCINEFQENYSVNQNLSFVLLLLSSNRLAMYKALLYLKTNLPVSSFTYSLCFKNGPPSQEKRGGVKCLMNRESPCMWPVKTLSHSSVVKIDP